MGERTGLFRGVVRNGVIVPDEGVTLPEGAVVKLIVEAPGLAPEEAAELAAWEQLSDEAWAMIDWGEGEIARDSG